MAILSPVTFTQWVLIVAAVMGLVCAVKDGAEFDENEEDVDAGADDNKVENRGAGVWPLRGAFGDVSSVAVHPNGELFLLHRGPNAWLATTFNESNVYQEFERGPIEADVLIGVSPNTGEELHRWGRNRFYLPHGLTIDADGNFWITDVALHQVFKVDPVSLELTLTLGEAGVPGSDKNHFCKPTDVAVTSTGDFFVSDGYCNSRIMKFDSKGNYLLEFGRPSDPSTIPAPADGLNIPHSLALIPKYDLICVANREDEKIQCFTAGLQGDVSAGQMVQQIAHPALSRVFAIDYSVPLNKLYAVNGVGFSLEDKPMSIFSIDLASNAISSWNPAEDGVDMVAPHDIALSPNGQYIFVADMAPQPTIWKFDNSDYDPRKE
ncbi:peptidyl-glycine alpha-amidating monooxygenase-like [Paramacrobiotus metropolitanus]|uniref:peptidyl-glycine alpha-amidating monooxygenase-like n=1 Tax=Paramacrobiotus metropolitanus TaxID=2943436 RepID=UPI002445A5A8|nr:peptidyl-glycine alpha-amidating monooxygenase-like [Paramacrobiotus metropolitanus]